MIKTNSKINSTWQISIKFGILFSMLISSPVGLYCHFFNNIKIADSLLLKERLKMRLS